MTGYRLLSPPSARWHVIGLSAYAPDPAHRLDNNKKEAPMMPIRSNPFTRRALCLTPLALALLAAESVQAATCTELLGREIPAQAIGLPSSGARVTAATPIAAGGSAPQTFGAYCDLSAEIRPVDPAAPAIRMRLVLPEQWNRKAMMFGGGGYNGTVPNVAGNVPAGPVINPRRSAVATRCSAAIPGMSPIR